MARSITNKELMEAYKRVPFPIREFLMEGQLGPAVQKLAQTYQLHVDAAGALIDILTQTLLGMTDPHDLPQELTTDLNLPQEQLKQLIQDLNTDIFMPLQKAVREYGPEPSYEERVEEDDPELALPAGEPAEAQPAPGPSVPVMQVGNPEVAAIPPAPEASIPPIVAAAAPAEVPPPPPPAASPLPQPLPPPIPIYSTEPVPTPYVRTMENDMELASQGLQGQAITPARSFQTASVPVTYASQMPPLNYVAAPQAAVAPLAPEPPVFPPPESYPAPVRLTPVDRTHASGVPIRKEFGSDPYREPIE